MVTVSPAALSGSCNRSCDRINLWNSMSKNAVEILNSLYGYDSFRGHQADIIEHVSAGNNALVLMPTGGGKSLCYQIPSLLRDGVGIIISPLIALMHDQVGAMQQLGVRAAFLNSSLTMIRKSLRGSC